MSAGLCVGTMMSAQNSQAAGSQTADSLVLGIDRMFELIETQNKTMSVLRSAHDAAEEGIKAAKSERLPEINAEINASYIGDAFLTDRDFSNFTKAETPHFGNGFTLQAQQVVYAGGAVKAGITLAENQSRMALYNVDKSRQGLRLMAVGQYLDLYKIGNNIKVYKENIALTEKLIDEINVRREQGLALANDVTRYELRLEMLRLALVRLENTRKVLNYRLCTTLCLPEDTVIEPVFGDSGEGDPASISEWQDKALENSPEIKLSGVNVDMAQAQYKLAKSDILPKIAVVAYENFNGPITFEIPPIDKNLNIWYVGLGVRYNFSALYKSNKKIRQAEITSRQASQAHDVASDNLRDDVQQAAIDYQQSFVELETSEKSLQLASENYQRVYDRYMEQLALITDMLDAFNVKLDAELGVSDAQAEIYYRYCKLKYVAGVL